MVRQWLEQFMLRGQPDAPKVAEDAARWFADYEYFGSHSRQVTLQDVLARGLKGVALESDQALQDAVLSVHHTYAHTFNGTAAVKIIENHLGRAWVKIAGPIFVAPGAPPQPTPSPSPTPTAPSGRPQTRADRRREQRGGRK
jgi:hypothetical protein